ncbi:MULTISPECIES: protein NO VEIN domain-containing protein [Actinosynnema]|uniref:protein NO VEIN domain-containing protein n=1 Tax=Actinosynnema TaxID=40566 RepID=UPI0020A5B0E9|nr:DUF3883 domain-containing protein [Actinosynnema pretiosum]
MHGFAYGIFLLARAARLKRRASVEEWVEAARTPRTHLAAAVDLAVPAEWLIKSGLVRVEGGRIALAPKLVPLSESASRPALLGIARVVLTTSPPPWLNLAVSSTEVAREYIPSGDARALQWLEPDLEKILIDVRDAARRQDSTFEEALGLAAELFVLGSLERSGADVLHVSRISDSYGYDLEAQEGERSSRIEVKAAGSTTRGTFHLSRNEFDKCRRHGSQWRLVQVVFTSEALVADRITPAHVFGVFELSSAALIATVPPDSDLPGFRWTESALVTPPKSAWRAAGITPAEGFSVPGLAELAHRSRRQQGDG